MDRVLPNQADELSAFLRQHLDIAMFPLANIRDFGIDGSHDYAMRFWVARDAGKITDAIGLANAGTVMPVCPNADWAVVAAMLAGQSVRNFIGQAKQVRPLMDVLGATGRAAMLDDDEPHFALELAKLRLLDGPGRIVPIADAPGDMVQAWMLDYQMNTLNTPPDEAKEQVQADYAHYCRAGSHVVLMDGTTPLAMTGFNARLPDAVQIGGVYTPPELRGRGYARRALALHLDQARSQGVARASLFAASQTAARAYSAIGFERIGDWTLCLLTDPFTISG